MTPELAARLKAADIGQACYHSRIAGGWDQKRAETQPVTRGPKTGHEFLRKDGGVSVPAALFAKLPL